MSDKDYQLYLTILRGQEKDLRMKDDWNKAAIKEYFKEVNKQAQKISATEVLKKILELYSQTQLKGSNLYTKMFEKCNYSEEEKISMLLKQLGAVMNQDTKTLQLTGNRKLDENMASHAEFLKLWPKTVQEAYKGNELTDARVHQLRMYIDRNNINYIRNKYGQGVSDEEALRRYVKAELSGEKMIIERASPQ